MRVFLGLYFPYWSTEIHSEIREKNILDTAPVILIEPSNSGFNVVRTNSIAESCDIKIGSSLDLAYAKSTSCNFSLISLPYNLDDDFLILERTAQALLSISPIVSIDKQRQKAYSLRVIPSPLYNGLLIDLTGCSKLYSSWEYLANSLQNAFQTLSITAQIAITTTTGASWALARFQTNSIVTTNSHELMSLINDLPIQALRIPEQKVVEINEFGICKISQLLSINRNSIYHRFGKEVIIALNYLTGAAHELLPSVQKPLLYKSKLKFDPPIILVKDIVLSLTHLITKLLGKITNDGKYTSSFSIKFITEPPPFCIENSINVRKKQNDHHKIVCRLTALPSLQKPNQVKKYLNEILIPLIERSHPQSPVKQIYLEGMDVVDLIHLQFDLNGESLIHEDTKRLMDSLTAAFDASQICSASFTNTWLPEKRSKFIRSIEKPSHSLSSNFLNESYPPVLLESPEPIKIVKDSNKELFTQFIWRNQKHKIYVIKGPKKINEEWWNLPNWEYGTKVIHREYYKMQTTDGLWLWIYRKSSFLDKWLIQGIWW